MTDNSIQTSSIEEWKARFEADSNNKLLQNVISHNEVGRLTTNRDVSQKMHHLFSHQVEPKTGITDQKRSGRCWIFAALNVVRRAMIQKYDLPKNFEFSQSYLFFWDKFERLNYHMELIIETYQTPIDSREVQKILTEPCEDGGQWDMFASLVNKYGLVPQYVFQESYHSSHSAELKVILRKKFQEISYEVRELLAISGNIEDARAKKMEFLSWAFGTLCKFLGTPPTESTNFNWEYYTKKDKYTCVDNLTPLRFYHEYVPFSVNDYICLVNDPRQEHPYYKQYTVKYLGNVLGGTPIRYINVPIEQMKRLTYQCIVNNQAVWFGCDFGKSRVDCEMNTQIRTTDLLLDTKFGLNKEQRLRYGTSLMTHAMVFTGCNVVDETTGQVNRWQVENSHGKKEPTEGYCLMTDDWYSEYVYEVAVLRNYLTVEMIEATKSTELIELPPWDPMGALAE